MRSPQAISTVTYRRNLRREVQARIGRTRDRATRYHLEDVVIRIDRILNPKG